jgi:hypothetical protein
MHRKEMKLAPKPKRWSLVNLALGLGLTIGVIWFAANFSYVSWDFRNNLWGPAHLLVQGQSPYRLELFFERGNPVWMHPAIALMISISLAKPQLRVLVIPGIISWFFGNPRGVLPQ